MTIKQSTYFDDKFNKLLYNIILAFFKISVQAGLTVYNLIDGIIDEFEDESGIETKTNATYDSINDLYSPTITIKSLIDYMEYVTNDDAQAEYVSNGATPVAIITQSQLTNNEAFGVDWTTATEAIAFSQGFKTATVDDIKKFTLTIRVLGGTTGGTITGYIYNDDGAGKPNAVLATFSNMNANLIGADFADFDFTGTYTPVVGTQYHIVIVWTSGTIGITMQLGANSSGGYADGNVSYYRTDIGWNAYSPHDCYFKLYQNIIPLQCYSESTIKSQGSYSLKINAQHSDSLNDTLTKTLSPTIDLSGRDQIKFDIYASRTGSNIKISFHDSGGTTIECTPNILVANSWQTVIVDISAISDANKDAIDWIKITIVNADADNTFYIDNMYAGEDLTNNMILISVAITAIAQPTKCRIVLFEEDIDSIILNTDLKAYMSRDNGASWTQLTLINEGNYDSSKKILASGSTDILSQPSGTSMKWKIETLNNKNLKLHSIGNNWD